MKALIFNFVISILLISSSFAQQDTLFPMETCPFDLTYDSTKNIIDSTGFYFRVQTNSFYGVKKVLSLNDTNIAIRKNSNTVKFKVNDIKSVKFYDGTKADKFMLLGAAVGFAGVLGLYSLSGDSSFTGFLTAIGVGVVVAVPCALIGSIVGLFFEDSHAYDLSFLSADQKKAKLKKLLMKYKNN